MSSPEVTEGDGYAVFSVSLSNAYLFDLDVALGLGDGGDSADGSGVDYGPGLEVYDTATNTWVSAANWTIPAGETSFMVRTPIIDDEFVEGTESFTLTATVTAGMPGDHSGTGTTTIEDNDTATWSISGDDTVAEGGTASYTMSLTGTLQAGETATIELALTDLDTTSADYAGFVAAVNAAIGSRTDLGFDGTTLTYTGDGNPMADLIISLAANDDTLVEGDEDFTVGLANPASGTGADIALDAAASVTTTIEDNDELSDGTDPDIVLIESSQGSANNPSKLTFTFNESGMDQSFFDQTKVDLTATTGGGNAFANLVLNSGVWGSATVNGVMVDTFTIDVVKNNNGTTYSVNVDPGAFNDGAGNPSTAASQVGLKPAGVSGDPINLGLTIPEADAGALVTVTVKDLPEGWVLKGGWSQGADESWTIQTTDVRQLSVTTPVAFAGALVLDMAMSWTSADGSTHSAHIANNVEAFAPGNPIFAWSGDDHLTGAEGGCGYVRRCRAGGERAAQATKPRR